MALSPWYPAESAQYDVPANDISWGVGPDIRAGNSMDGDGLATCRDQQGPYTVEIFDTPDTPTSFSGATSVAGDSELDFTVPGTASYVADVRVTQGAIRVQTAAGAQTVVSTATVDEGTLSSNDGVEQLNVSGLGGPQALWTISIHAVPIVLSGPAFAVPAAQPGQPVRATYSLTASGTVTAGIFRPGGSLLRSLASGLTAGVGARSLYWDGLDANGSPIHDGTYRLELTATDAAGNSANGAATLLIDSRPPRITTVSARRLAPTHGLVVKITDTGSGVAQAKLYVGRHLVARLHSAGRFIYRPRAGWHPSARYRYRVTAGDRVGNSKTVERTFTTKPGSG